MKIIDSITFECTKCGDCCRWDGVVKLTPEDISRLAEHKGIDKQEFVKEYTVNGKILKNKERSKDCVFLKGNQCSVWDKRPKQCDEFPKKYTPKCPGFKTDRSTSMYDFKVAVKMAKEKMENSQDYLQSISDNLYKDLQAGVKSSNVTTMALEAGIDSYLSEGPVKIASLDDLFSFDRVANDMLIHKCTRDLWSIYTDKDGNVQIMRQFDASGEPVKG